MLSDILEMANQGRRKPSILSLEETGVARIIFFEDNFNRFDGVLINSEEECFGLHGFRLPPSPQPSESSLPVLVTASDVASSVFEVTVIDGVTGNQFALKRVAMTSGKSAEGFPTVTFSSDNISFQTGEVLIGNRADMELRTYISPGLVEKGYSVHLGTMTLNIHTAVTPPPTPSSSCNDVEEMDQDYLS